MRNNVVPVVSAECLSNVFSVPSIRTFGMNDRDFVRFFSPQKDYALLQGRGIGKLRVNEAVGEILELLNSREAQPYKNRFVLQIVYPSSRPLLLNELEDLPLIGKRLRGTPLWSLTEIEKMETDVLINLSFAK